VKETTKAYVAGLIDAEGCYTLSRHVRPDGYVMFDPLIRFTTSHLPTAKWVKDNFGGYFSTKNWPNNQWKTYYQWRIGNDSEASSFLTLIKPYIWEKIAEAGIIEEYYLLRGIQNKPAREVLYQKMVEYRERKSVTTNTSDFPFNTNIAHAYLAGFFDGEGSIYFVEAKNTIRIDISLGNTFEPAIKAYQKVFGGHSRKRDPHNGILPIYEWKIGRQSDLETFLLSVLPYLVTKREQAKIALDFVRNRKNITLEEGRKIKEHVSELNGKKIESELTGDRESALPVTETA
jgi:hypothetical protein